ncbi:oxygenase MpaB family protein [Trujillonella humicola]|uniref:oxygenase MpaB family protein n=1 Tax=Trujillonella humicola TaxID=3383699 RepID=UPI0039067148
MSTNRFTTGRRAGRNTLTSRRKWLDERIERLDVETDHAEIVRLSTLYRLNDMQLHWFYSVGTPGAGIAPAVIDAVYRHGTGKYVTQAAKRRDDSVDHMLTWFEHGSDAEATRKSVGMVNKYHAHFAREFPDGFANADDYVYILCLNATLVETATTSLGLPGLTDKQKAAMHRLWAGIAEQFTMPDGSPVTNLEPFPDSFDGMVTYVEEYQARPWPVHQPGHQATTAEIEHFATTWFPRPLHFFGRALVTAFMSPHVMRAHAIEPPPAALAWLARRTMKVMMLLSIRVLPDNPESYTDRRRRLASIGRGAPSPVDTAVHRSLSRGRAGSDVPAGPSACPHLAAVVRH